MRRVRGWHKRDARRAHVLVLLGLGLGAFTSHVRLVGPLSLWGEGSCLRSQGCAKCQSPGVLCG